MSLSDGSSNTGTPHSAEWFNPVRNYWWNRDFLELMASRLRLGDVTSLADFGCGTGFWSGLLFPLLNKRAWIFGVDREARWLSIAKEEFLRTFPHRWACFVHADAAAIPVQDDYFDAVTCQTLLIHLANPEACLSEMIRVAKPGGLILCVEPNNVFNMLDRGSVAATVEEQLADYEFWLRWRAGKLALGEGDNALGDLLPGLFASAGLSDVRVHLNDQVSALFPPYELPAQKAALQEEQSPSRRGSGSWGAESLKRYYLEGGGGAADFDTHITRLAQRAKARRAAIQRGEFHEAGGGLFYIVSGRKPQIP